MFVVSYTIFLSLTDDNNGLSVVKISYTLVLGELDFEDLSLVRFIGFVAYTGLITIVLMNLLIGVLTMSLDIVVSEL